MEVYETREISDLVSDCYYRKKPSRDYEKSNYNRKPDYKPSVVRRR